MHLSVDEVGVLLGADDLTVLEIVAAGHLALGPDGIAQDEVERLMVLLETAFRG